MSVAHVQPEPQMTEHALLVLYGRFADQVGLIDALKQVPSSAFEVVRMGTIVTE